MKRFFKYLCISLATVFCFMLVGCTSENAVGDSGMNRSGGVGGDGTGLSQPVENELDRKIVYDAYLSISTEEISEAKTQLDSKCSSLGGYIESQSESYAEGECTYAYITYRIPTAKLNDFIVEAEGNGTVIDKTVSSTDITTTYVNATAQKTALQARKAALQAILEDTTITASDRIEVIKEIAEVDTELQYIELLLTEYDSMVDYSTVNISLEADAYTDLNLDNIVLIPLIVIGCILLAGGIFCAIFFPIYCTRKKHKKQ